MSNPTSPLGRPIPRDPRFNRPSQLDARGGRGGSREAQPPKRRGIIGVVITAAIFLFGKLKYAFAALKILKLQTLFSMLLSVAFYIPLFGWKFALGFVLLIFVHEMGHALAMRQQGIPAGAPVFIPFVGAVIAMKGRPRDAFVEAIVGIGGPALGTLGAALCLGIAITAQSPFWFALASTGFLLNLFNMIPISPLDGGRIAGAISRWFWLVGYAIGIPLFLVTESPILMLILLLGVFTIYRLWKQPIEGYYDIPAWKRVGVGAGYFGLMALMVLGMTLADAGFAELQPASQAALWLVPGLHALGGLLRAPGYSSGKLQPGPKSRVG